MPVTGGVQRKTFIGAREKDPARAHAVTTRLLRVLVGLYAPEDVPLGVLEVRQPAYRRDRHLRERDRTARLRRRADDVVDGRNIDRAHVRIHGGALDRPAAAARQEPAVDTAIRVGA